MCGRPVVSWRASGASCRPDNVVHRPAQAEWDCWSPSQSHHQVRTFTVQSKPRFEPGSQAANLERLVNECMTDIKVCGLQGEALVCAPDTDPRPLLVTCGNKYRNGGRALDVLTVGLGLAFGGEHKADDQRAEPARYRRLADRAISQAVTSLDGVRRIKPDPGYQLCAKCTVTQLGLVTLADVARFRRNGFWCTGGAGSPQTGRLVRRSVSS